MQAKVLDVPLVVTDQERADEWADQLEDLLLEVGRIFPRADLRCRAAAFTRAGRTGSLSRVRASIRDLRCWAALRPLISCVRTGHHPLPWQQRLPRLGRVSQPVMIAAAASTRSLI